MKKLLPLFLFLFLFTVPAFAATTTMLPPITPVIVCNADGSECHTGTPTDPIWVTGTVFQGTTPWNVNVINIPHIILDSGTITSITNPVTVTGTVIANQGTSPWIISGTVTSNQGGTWNINTITSIINPVAVTGTFWQATQPVSLVTLPALTTGAATIGNVNINGNGTVFSGQQAVTTSSVALPTNSSKGVCVRSSINSTVTIYIGPSGVTTSTGHELNPGDSVCIPVSNTNLLFAISTATGGTVTFLGSN